MALTAVLAAYMLASSWNLPMFFLYRILLLPNQFDTCQTGVDTVDAVVGLQQNSSGHERNQRNTFGSIQMCSVDGFSFP